MSAEDSSIMANNSVNGDGSAVGSSSSPAALPQKSLSDSAVVTLADLNLEDNPSTVSAGNIDNAAPSPQQTALPLQDGSSSIPSAPMASSEEQARIANGNDDPVSAGEGSSISSSLPVTATSTLIKSRDFVNTPPISSPSATVKPLPAAPSPRPSPTTLPPSSSALPSGGMASAPIIQTLSSTTNGVGAAPVRPSPASRPSQAAMSSSGAPGGVRSGMGGRAPPGSMASRIPPSLQAKMAAMASRSSNPTSVNTHIGAGERFNASALLGKQGGLAGAGIGSPVAGSSMTPPMGGRPSPAAPGRVGASGPLSGGRGPAMPGNGLAKRRGPGAGLSLAQMGGSSAGPTAEGSSPVGNGTTGPPMGRANRPQMKLPPGSSGMDGSGGAGGGAGHTAFSNFSKIVDPSGSLKFGGKAVLHAKGVDFSNGSSFAINMGELELQDELGSGNYGTVQKVYHKVTKVTMAMKEIRLELDDSKLKGIITELDILHRATAPEIVEFYGAFFIESCVYYCMEYMDAGSLDKLGGVNVPEPVLKRVSASMVRGLKFLKDELQTMHRDVKPTNVLVNSAGAVKLCDFGVSGQLEKSLAKTNIGCQSYMAPERIKGESQNFLGTYTVSSDVWSLGLSIIEFTLGHYPYPPETYSNVFAQLQAIVHGDPPSLPHGYSSDADDFVAACLHKDANKRPTYGQLLQSPFLRDESTMDVDMAGWVKEALAFKAANKLGASTGSSTSSSSSSSSTIPA